MGFVIRIADKVRLTMNDINMMLGSKPSFY